MEEETCVEVILDKWFIKVDVLAILDLVHCHIKCTKDLSK